MPGCRAGKHLASAAPGFLMAMFVACWVLAGTTSLSNAIAWNGRTFSADGDLNDKVLTGDGVVTYDDVSVLTCALRCLRVLMCAFFFYNRADRTCAVSPLSASATCTTLIDAPGYQLVSNIQGKSDEMDICAAGTVTPGDCWRQMADDLTHVSAGPAGVWGTKGNPGSIFYRNGSYQQPDASATTGWTAVQGSLNQVDVGSDFMWGWNYNSNLFYRAGISSLSPSGSQWVHFWGGFRWVSVSPQSSVWAVNLTGHLLHGANAANGSLPVDQWEAVATPDAGLQRVDAGWAGVWALDNAQRLHYRLGTRGQDGVAGTGWRQVGLQVFSSVSAGKDLVVAVDTAGHVWLRTCMDADTPVSLGWYWLSGGMAQAEIYQSGDVTAIWAVDMSGKTYFYLLG